MSAGALEKQVEKAVVKATGERFCTYGRHYVLADRIVHEKPRACCRRCADEIAAKREKSR